MSADPMSATPDEESNDGDSHFPNPMSAYLPHYIVKTVLRGSAVGHAVAGHIRSPSSIDIVFGKIHGRDLLVVISDSGYLSFLAFCSERQRFFAVTHFPIFPECLVTNSGYVVKTTSLPEHQLDKMLAVDPAAYADLFSLFPVSKSAGNNIVNEKIIYSPGDELEISVEKEFEPVDDIPNEDDSDIDESKGESRVCGTIWSMCFIPGENKEGCNPVLAVLMYM